MKRILAALIFSICLTSPVPANAADSDTWKGGRAYENYCTQYSNTKTILTIVDASAPYTAADIARLSRGLKVMRDEHGIDAPGYRLEVHSVGSVVEQSQRLFSGCVPACPTNLGLIEDCPKPMVKRDMDAFWKAIEETMSKKLGTGEKPPGSETALAETIEWVTRNQRPAELVIFSDFLEFHAQGGGLPRITFYSPTEGGMNAYMKALKTKNYIPNLSTTKVIGFGLGQELGGTSNFTKKSGGLTAGQWQIVNKFWTLYLQEAGASGFSLSREFPGATPQADAPPPPPERRRAGI